MSINDFLFYAALSHSTPKVVLVQDKQGKVHFRMNNSIVSVDHLVRVDVDLTRFNNSPSHVYIGGVTEQVHT